MSRQWQGQSKSEFLKNYKRVKDIVDKSDGDEEKQFKLSTTQANRITNEDKCINRAMAAKELGYMNIHDVFFERAYTLGRIPTEEYREYVFAKMGI